MGDCAVDNCINTAILRGYCKAHVELHAAGFNPYNVPVEQKQEPEPKGFMAGIAAKIAAKQSGQAGQTTSITINPRVLNAGLTNSLIDSVIRSYAEQDELKMQEQRRANRRLVDPYSEHLVSAAGTTVYMDDHSAGCSVWSAGTTRGHK